MYMSYNPYECNFEIDVKIAKGMTDKGLVSAIAECLELISLGINVDKYADQAKIYRQELAKRIK